MHLTNCFFKFLFLHSAKCSEFKSVAKYYRCDNVILGTGCRTPQRLMLYEYGAMVK